MDSVSDALQTWDFCANGAQNGAVPQLGNDWGSGRGETTGTSAALQEKACEKNRAPKPFCLSVKAALLTACMSILHCCQQECFPLQLARES